MAETIKTFSTLTVDLSEVKTVEALHAALNEAFEFPEYYGGNLDALHDCLTDIAVKATEAEPITVTFAGYKKAKRALGSDFHNFRNVLNDVSVPELHCGVETEGLSKYLKKKKHNKVRN